ncbi:MAG: hypothetical protein ABJG88_10295 [Litorimonas sp.]
MQRKLLYFPPQNYLSASDVGLANMAEIPFSINGIETTSWWSAPVDDIKPVILFFHGNGSAVYSNYDIFGDLIAQGYGVLSVGYPGYPHKGMDATGPNGGPSQDKILAVAIKNHEFISGENITPDRIVYFGTSLGSGIASQLAAIHPPQLLILDAPFNSILDMAKKRAPFLPVSLLMQDRFESDKALAGRDVTLIWMHGTDDRIVPIAQGQKLYDGYDGPKTAYIIHRGQHTNLWGLGGRDIVLRALSQL